MSKKIFSLFACTLLLILSSSCTTVTKQSKKTTIMDASQEDTLGGTGTSSADVRSMAERIAREFVGLSWPEELIKPRIALMSIDNQTRFPFNPNVIKDRLLVDLLEFSTGSKLQFTENPQNADYFLETRITALSKGSSEGVSDYLLYSFKLRDKGDTVLWAKAYETKKQGNVGVMYR